MNDNFYFKITNTTDEIIMIKLKIRRVTYCILTYKINYDINTIYLYTIQTYEKKRHNGYATKMMTYFIEYFNEFNILTKVIGGEENIGCMKLLLNFNFKSIKIDNDSFMIRNSILKI